MKLCIYIFPFLLKDKKLPTKRSLQTSEWKCKLPSVCLPLSTMCQFLKHVQCLVLQFKNLLVFPLCVFVRLCVMQESVNVKRSLGHSAHLPTVSQWLPHSWCLCLWVCLYKSAHGHYHDKSKTCTLSYNKSTWLIFIMLDELSVKCWGIKSNSIIPEQKLWDVWQSSCWSCVTI